MKLSEEIKSKIKLEYDEWFESQYAGKSKEERQKLGQFFTPPELTIKMIEKFDSLDKNKDILDPACGAGGLLAAMIIAGANPKRVYGIEIDESIAEVCRKRLSKFGVPENNIKIGNALNSDSYEFSVEQSNISHDQKALVISIDSKTSMAKIKVISFPFVVKKELDLDINSDIFYKLLQSSINKDFWIICNQSYLLRSVPERLLSVSENDIQYLIDKHKFDSFDDFLLILNDNEKEDEK